MATKKQKQELMDTLRFTPVRVRMLIQGYGGECYAGRVDRKIYEYFKSQRIDLEEYASDWDGVFNDNVPSDMQPFNPGNPYDCDNLFHASGAELSNLNSLTVEEVDSGNTVWDFNCGYSELDDAGVSVQESGGGEILDLVDGDTEAVAIWGGQGEKGCFFDAEFTLRAPFDPKKLTIYYENCDDWYIISSVEYDGEELDGSGGYSTTGKWNEHKWVLLNDEEPYDSVLLDDREDEGLEWGTASTEVTEIISDEEEEALLASIRKAQESDVECVQCSWKGLVDETNDNDGEMVCPECGEPVEFIDKDWEPATELDKIIEEHQVTEWFSSDIKPVHKGEYECEFKVVTWPWPAVRMCEWTGRSWKESTGDRVNGEFRWRGVKEEFKDAV